MGTNENVHGNTTTTVAVLHTIHGEMQDYKPALKDLHIHTNTSWIGGEHVLRTARGAGNNK